MRYETDILWCDNLVHLLNDIFIPGTGPVTRLLPIFILVSKLDPSILTYHRGRKGNNLRFLDEQEFHSFIHCVRRMALTEILFYNKNKNTRHGLRSVGLSLWFFLSLHPTVKTLEWMLSTIIVQHKTNWRLMMIQSNIAQFLLKSLFDLGSKLTLKILEKQLFNKWGWTLPLIKRKENFLIIFSSWLFYFFSLIKCFLPDAARNFWCIL